MHPHLRVIQDCCSPIQPRMAGCRLLQGLYHSYNLVVTSTRSMAPILVFTWRWKGVLHIVHMPCEVILTRFGGGKKKRCFWPLKHVRLHKITYLISKRTYIWTDRWAILAVLFVTGGSLRHLTWEHAFLPDLNTHISFFHIKREISEALRGSGHFLLRFSRWKWV